MLGFFLFLHAVDADAKTTAVSHGLSAVSQSIPPAIVGYPHRLIANQ
jgi:hypothetical protein